MTNQVSNKYQVFYHKNCNDGTGAAVAMYSKVPTGSSFTPIQYGDDVEIEDGVTHVMFLDFTPAPDKLNSVLKVLPEDGRVIILDHHMTGVSNLETFLSGGGDDRVLYYIDQGKCGSMISHIVKRPSNYIRSENPIKDKEIFTNIESTSIMSPFNPVKDSKYEFYTLLDIRDRWIETTPELKVRADELSSFLYLSGWTDKDVKECAEILNVLTRDDIDEMVNIGSYVNQLNMKKSKSMVEKSKKFDVKDKDGKLIKLALTFTNDVVSDAGSIWSSENPDVGSLFVGVMILPHDELVVLSTRSNDHASAKVFCEALGGGGHVRASGARVEDFYNKTPNEMIEVIIDTIEKNSIAV